MENKLDELTKGSLTLVHDHNSPIVKTFSVPVGNKSKKEAEQELAALIADYQEDIVWDDVTGELTVNNSMSKHEDFWLPVDPNNPSNIVIDLETGVITTEYIAPVTGIAKKKWWHFFTKKNK